MKLPKNYFENLSSTKFREYLKLLPNMKNESTKAITMLIFTFIALSFLVIFAINPTLSTIIDLHKQLEDDQYVHEQLTTKENNLSSLQQQYTQISSELPVVADAIPTNAQVGYLTGQLQSLAQESNLQLLNVSINSVVLGDSKQKAATTNTSFAFTLQAQGKYDDMLSFAAVLTHFNRLITIDTIGITKDTKTDAITLNVTGRGYFKK